MTHPSRAPHAARNADPSCEPQGEPIPIRHDPFQVGPWALTLVALIAVAAYADSLTYRFVWDDAMMVLQNWRLRNPANLWQLLRADFTVLTSGLMEGHYYRPVTALSLALDAWLWGPVPGPFHLTNVLLHAFATVLVGRLAIALGSGRPIAVLAALVFALHPAHVEAVVFVSARSDLLPAVGILGCLIAYRKAAVPNGCRRSWLVLAAALLLVSLLAKESAIVLPALLCLSDLLFPVPREHTLTRAGWWHPLGRSLPFWGLTAAFVAWRLPAIHHLTGERVGLAELWRRLPGSLEILARYAGLLVLPSHMRPFYSVPRPHSFLDAGPLLGLVTLGGLLAIIARAWRRAPVAAFGAAWFLITTLPVLDLVPLSFREMGLADRYLYLPSIGWSLGLAWGLAAAFGPCGDSVRRVRRAAAWTGVAGVLALYAWWLLAYAPVWRDNVSLYTRMEQVAPRSPTPALNLGLAYFRADDLTQATQSVERAVRVNPTLHRPRAILALLYVLQGRSADGFRILSALDAEGATDRDYYVASATAYLEVGDVARATAAAEAGARAYPGDATLQELLARGLERGGSPAEAARRYRDALALNPDLIQAEEGLARLYLRAGDPAQAERHLLRVIEMRPDRPQALRELAVLREAQGDRVQSLQLWRDVLSLAPNGIIIREAIDHIRRLGGSPVTSEPTMNRGRRP